MNNDFYQTLGQTWYTGQDHPAALLRAEAKLKNPWVSQLIRNRVGVEAKVLDIGCGGGLLSNELARERFLVTGIDQSSGALDTARQTDSTKTVDYVLGNAENLPFASGQFDVACCLDVLEHVEDPRRVVAEACRVLRPGGIFLFHTFNRTWLANILVIYGVEIFFKNVPANLHVYSKFITPAELSHFCRAADSEVVEWTGMKVVLNWKMAKEILRTKEVPKDLYFKFCKSLRVGYLGVAVKR